MDVKRLVMICCNSVVHCYWCFYFYYLRWIAFIASSSLCWRFVLFCWFYRVSFAVDLVVIVCLLLLYGFVIDLLLAVGFRFYRFARFDGFWCCVKSCSGSLISADCFGLHGFRAVVVGSVAG